MPVPKPKPGESEQDFVSRCIASLSGEYDQSQAAAICYNEFQTNELKTKIKSLEDQLKNLDQSKK